MTATQAQRIVDKSLDTRSSELRCQAAIAQHAIANQEALAFAERIGEMLEWSLRGDLRQGQTAMLQIAMWRAER